MSSSPELLCPLVHTDLVAPCDPALLDPAIAWLRSNTPLDAPLVFPRGTALPDGRLDMCKQSIGPEGASMILDAMSGNDHIHDLLLGTDGIGDEGARALADFVSDSDGLRTVYLGCNCIGPEGTKHLAEAISGSTRARALWLKRNPIGPEGAEHIAQMLQAGRHNLDTLDLVNTGLGDAGVQIIARALPDESPIERLYLGGNGLGPPGAHAISDLLARTKNLGALHLNISRLGDEGAAVIAEGLAGNQTLHTLSLASNDIGPEGIARFFEAIGDHPALARLDLGCSPATRALDERPNRFGDQGCVAIARWLRTSTHLRRLDLRGSGLTSRGAYAIKEALIDTDNRTLVSIIFGKNVARKIRRALHPRLDRNARLTHNGNEAPIPEPLARIQSVYRTSRHKETP